MLVAALVSSGARGPDVPKTREFSATVRVRNSVQLLNGRAKQVRLGLVAPGHVRLVVDDDHVRSAVAVNVARGVPLKPARLILGNDAPAELTPAVVLEPIQGGALLAEGRRLVANIDTGKVEV